MGMDDTDIEEAGGKRVTVLFNARDWALIKAEVDRRSAEKGYPVPLSDALRELVREHWTTEAEASS